MENKDFIFDDFTEEDFNLVKAKLDTLPDVELPDCLSAENLFAKMDSMAENTEEIPEKKNKVVKFPKKLKQALLYAAAFAVVATVYYSYDADSQHGFIKSDEVMETEAAAENSMLFKAAPEEADAEESKGMLLSALPPVPNDALTEAPAPEPEEEIGADSGDETDGIPVEEMKTYGFYEDNTTVADYENMTAPKAVGLDQKTVSFADGATVQYEKTFAKNKIYRYFDKNTVESIETGGRDIIAIENVDELLAVAELVDNDIESYTYEACPEGKIFDSAVSVTYYDVDSLKPKYTVVQEGYPVLSYKLEGKMLTITRKPVIGKGGLSEMAPMVKKDGTMKEIPVSQVIMYPTGQLSEYLIVSYGDAEEYDTGAVMGSDMTATATKKGVDVLSKNIETQYSPYATLDVGEIKVKIR